MEDEKIIELSEKILNNHDNPPKPLAAMLYIANDDYTALVYAVQKKIISERFTVGTGGLFLDGLPISPIAKNPPA